MPATEIVVGIDFGTTYSGAAWARNVVNSGKKKPKDTIRIIKDWPKDGVENSDAVKVPSCISYKSDGKPDKYGYLAEKEENVIRWFKILLDASNQNLDTELVKLVENSNTLLKKFNKTPKDVVTDYLRWIWGRTLRDINRHTSKMEQKTLKKRVVLTVPAIWSHDAKSKMLEAALAAELPENIQLLTEPEAAALAVLKGGEEIYSFEVGDCIVLCDAGGGTVDLISYKIESLEPLKFREIAVGDGGLCGSVCLDIGFERLVSTLVGNPTYDNLPWNRKKGMIDKFEHGIKRRFGEDDDEEYSVELYGIKSTSKYVLDDLITVPRGMLQPIFDKVCGQIKDLIGKQIHEVEDEEKENFVKAILLVGGLGESTYLYDRLEAEYKGWYASQGEDTSIYSDETTSASSIGIWTGVEGIEVIQCMHPWSAICEGATLRGLEHSAISSRRARYSYGISINDPTDLSTDQNEKKKLDYTRKPGPRRQVKWLFQKGHEIAQDSRMEIKLPPEDVNIFPYNLGRRVFRRDIYYSDDPTPAKTLESSIKRLGSLNVSIAYNDLKRGELVGDIPGRLFKGKKQRAEFCIQVLFGETMLEFQMLYIYLETVDGTEHRRKKPVGSVEIEYGDAVAG